MTVGLFPVIALADGGAVAKVGDTIMYTSLQDVVNGAKTNGTIELLQDIALDGDSLSEGTALLQIDGTLTIEGNDHASSTIGNNIM